MGRLSLMLAGMLGASPARAQPTIAPGLRDWAVRLLTSMIETTREQAIADGVRPVPPAIYRGLLGYFPAALLQKVRFGGTDTGRIALPTLAFTYGHAAGITLGDVILFRDKRAAQTDLKLWVHELTHVLQYQRWGVDGFAARYVDDSGAVEQEARDNVARFSRWKGELLR